MASWRRYVPYVWSVALALLMLGPALGRGYVLSYDMVWVPDLSLRSSFLGLGSGLPRAVPSDAVVAVLDEIVPGMLLQKIVLLGVLVVAGAGVVRLTERSLAAQLVAVTAYVWNPFVAERLVIGHWPVLVGYAVLPWVIDAAQTWRTSGQLPLRLWWLVPVGSLSASAGLATAVALLAFALVRGAGRARMLVALVLAGNAPWIVSGLLHAGDTVTSAVGAGTFALHGEGSVPAPLAALSLGGIWNSEVVPASRTGVLGWVSLLFVVGIVAVGWRRWRRDVGARDVSGFVWCWAVGWGFAVLTWLAPTPLGWLVAHVPGFGLLRDGSRLLSLSAVGLAVVAGYGASTLVRRLPVAARPGTLLALVLVPLALLPDAALGIAGRLQPVAYPDDLLAARGVVASAHDRGAPGDVLLLPMSSYRQPSWNHGNKVLDPVGRLLPLDYVASDDLFVDGVRIAGEDKRARAAAAVLRAPTPGQRASGLSGLGVGFVVTERDAGRSPLVAGHALLDRPGVLVQQLRDVHEQTTPTPWIVAMAGAWTVFVAAPLAAVVVALRRRVRRRAPNR
ncbi:hypothetical protein [Marmoricola sp. URHB0036]|uniref:hypothetical protein n=1 Tax=Marmoricola sp. URHB0036 TaxID=1298863 RepID=UPI0003FBDBBF|nr:hypothetical protein [Marmoricola sp. URHB0036]